MIIDTHAQLFTRELIDLFNRGEIPGMDALGYGFFFAKGAPEDTLADMDAAGVEKSVVVAIDAETVSGYRIPNDLVAQAVEKYPGRLIGLGSVDPHKGVLAVREVERLARELKLKGLKFIPHLLELNPDDRLFYPVYEAAQELGLPVLFHTGTHYHLGKKLKYCLPLPLDEVAVDFPNLKIILAHFGFPWFAEALAICQRNQNVYFNIAGWAPRYIPEMVIQYINGPLSRKALLGSDHPLLSRKRILDELKEIPLKDESRSRLLEENARGLFNL
ncbi:MAG: amidohydrolase family protein [Proteobacteria bacterium]|nr:amidohydrolase family protein [Pseudomonadota bacterium]